MGSSRVALPTRSMLSAETVDTPHNKQYRQSTPMKIFEELFMFLFKISKAGLVRQTIETSAKQTEHLKRSPLMEI